MDRDEVFARYYNLALRYLSYRPRSEKEVLDYLVKKSKNKKLNLKNENEAEEIITKIMERLKELKFIDDREFVKFWVEQRTKYKNKPVRVIEYELKQKGISQSLISESLFENKNETDLKSAKKLATKKMDFYRSLPPDKRREKVINYLLRKGFSYDTVKKAVK